MSNISMDKPKMFKMGGHWLWLCNHGDGEMGDTLNEENYSDTWSACLALAVKHWAFYHDNSAKEEDIEILDPRDLGF